MQSTYSVTKTYLYHSQAVGVVPRSQGAPSLLVFLHGIQSSLCQCFGHLFLLHGTQVLTKPLAYNIILYHKKHFGTLNPLVSKTTTILHFSPPSLSLSRGPFLFQPEETAVLKRSAYLLGWPETNLPPLDLANQSSKFMSKLNSRSLDQTRLISFGKAIQRRRAFQTPEETLLYMQTGGYLLIWICDQLLQTTTSSLFTS